jgi:hypothetical protein
MGELCRIIRHLGSGIGFGVRFWGLAKRIKNDSGGHRERGKWPFRTEVRRTIAKNRPLFICNCLQVKNRTTKLDDV